MINTKKFIIAVIVELVVLALSYWYIQNPCCYNHLFDLLSGLGIASSGIALLVTLFLYVFSRLFKWTTRKTLVLASLIYSVWYAFTYIPEIISEATLRSQCQGMNFFTKPECMPPIEPTIMPNPSDIVFSSVPHVLFYLAVIYIFVELIIWVTNKFKTHD